MYPIASNSTEAVSVCKKIQQKIKRERRKENQLQSLVYSLLLDLIITKRRDKASYNLEERMRELIALERINNVT